MFDVTSLFVPETRSGFLNGFSGGVFCLAVCCSVIFTICVMFCMLGYDVMTRGVTIIVKRIAY